MNLENLNPEQEDNKTEKIKKNSFLKEGFLFVKETFTIVIICLVIVVAVRHYLIQPFFVNGKSMEPNFYDGEYLIVDEFDYRFFDKPARGDVIVFRYPNDPSQFYIKRIIGLPNEKVAIENNQVIIYNSLHPNGMVLNESIYLPPNVLTKGDGVTYETKENEYFVLGDNRSVSADSRFWGELDENLIVGRVWIRAWPFNRFSVFKTPEY